MTSSGHTQRRLPLDDRAPAPNPLGETRLERHIRLLTDVRDRLRATIAAHGLLRTIPSEPVPCGLHGVPWTACTACSKPRTT